MSGELIPMFFKQWARDIAGAQIRDRLGLETLGNWIGAPDITAGDITPDQYDALRETALRVMSQPEREVEGYGGNRWELKYPDYGFSVTDPEHATNKAFEAIMGGYDIDYDYSGWDKYGPGYRGNKEAIDELVEASKGWSTVSNPHSPLATQAAAGKGPAVTSSDLYKTLRGAAGLIPRMTDPAAVLQQTFGRAAIIRDPDTGNYYVEDRYNWNDRLGHQFDPFSREDWGSLREDLSEGEDIYDKARVLSGYFGSRSGEGQEPEGSHVRINLGQLDDYYLDEAGQLASREEEDGFQLSDIGEFVRRQGSKVMDFFDRPEEEAPPRLVEQTEQREPTVSSTIPSAPAPVIPSAPGAIEVADISRQMGAAQERDRLLREMRAGRRQ